MKPILHIGNKRYSSWSLRPWLCLRWAGIEFSERQIRLDQPGYGRGRIAEILATSPTGRVPALLVDGHVIWDSLAIGEWAAEQVAAGKLWPRDAWRRAEARSIACEMHSGFPALRRDLPMNIPRRCAAQQWKPDVRDDLERMMRLWTDCRRVHHADGPWLLGARSIADAFFTPVATRMRSYSIVLPEAAAAYCATLLGDADFREWESAALREAPDVANVFHIEDIYA